MIVGVCPMGKVVKLKIWWSDAVIEGIGHCFD